MDTPRKKRSRRRRKPKSRTKVEPIDKKQNQPSPSSQLHKQHQNQIQMKKQHDAPMTKRDLYFALCCGMVGIGGRQSRGSGATESSAVGRVTLVNWENQVVLDTFVQIPVPVTDFRTETSGIAPSDVGSTNAMSFAQVRAEVERILRGKILIGHGLSASLNALGLTHPWCDIRDTSTYAKFVVEETDRSSGRKVLRPQPLADLSAQILKREVPPATVPHRPVDLCVAALDLYKMFRREWEEDLIHAAQQKDARLESQQRERAEQRRQQHQMSFQQASPGLALQHPQGQPPMYHHPNHQPQRPRVHSYEVLPPEILQQYVAYGGVVPTMQQQPPAMSPQMVVPPHDMQAAAAMQSSWFHLGRKPRFHQAVPHHGMAPSPALSSHAMQVLSAHEAASNLDSPIRLDGSNYGGSYYDTSTQYDASTEYDSSVYYEESVASESVASESVVSTQQEETPSPTSHRESDARSQENSSWFRFGSRRSSRYPPQQQRMTQPLTSLAEDEPHNDTSIVQSLQDSSAHVPVTGQAEGVRYYEPPRYYASGVQGKSSSSNSSWFGFRRSKSPSSVKSGREAMAKPEGADSPTADLKVVEEVVTESMDSNMPSELGHEVSLAEATVAEVAAPESESDEQTDEGEHVSEKTKWFGFRRSKSPKLSNDSEDELEEFDDTPPTVGRDSVGAVPNTQDSTTADDSYSVDATADSPNSFFSYDSRKTEEPMQAEKTSQSNSWFGFRRGKSSKNEPTDGNEISDNPVPTDSTDGSDEDWLQEVIHQRPVEEYQFHEGACDERFECQTDEFNQEDNEGMDTKPPSPEQAELLESHHQASSWSIFRRSKPSKNRLVEDDASSDKQALPEEPTEATDEDWLREVMHDAVTESDLAILSPEGPEDSEGCDDVKARDMQHQPVNNWFKLFRSSKSSRPVSRLASAASAALNEEERRADGACVEQVIVPTNSFHEDDWLSSPSVESSCINPAWLDFREAESPPETQPMTLTEHHGVDLADDINYFLRSRLCTESTLATVASNSTAEEEREAMQAYEGVEQSFNFLNI